MTARRTRDHRQAHAELLAAARWYEDEQAGLGLRFVDAIDQAISDIKAWPDAAPPVDDWIGEPRLRTKLVVVFPYRIIYYVTAGQIVIVAYAHQRRRPDFWLGRVRRSGGLSQR